jgi:hypothetical protein
LMASTYLMYFNEISKIRVIEIEVVLRWRYTIILKQQNQRTNSHEIIITIKYFFVIFSIRQPNMLAVRFSQEQDIHRPEVSCSRMGSYRLR